MFAAIVVEYAYCSHPVGFDYDPPTRLLLDYMHRDNYFVWDWETRTSKKGIHISINEIMTSNKV